MDRRIAVTSDPPGALVYLNDVEVGRTPVETGFAFYGKYDVRVLHEGHEPVWTGKWAHAPWYEYPPLDLIAAALPFWVVTTVRWHFDLEPARRPAEGELLRRAQELRASVEPRVPRHPGADSRD